MVFFKNFCFLKLSSELTSKYVAKGSAWVLTLVHVSVDFSPLKEEHNDDLVLWMLELALAVMLVDNGIGVSHGVGVSIDIGNSIGIDIVGNCFRYKIEM